MSNPRRDDNHADEHYTTAAGHQRSRSRITRAAPHPDVVAAAEFLLAEPDAYLYRRRYLELIAHIPGPDGTLITDYTAAEQYLLTTAAKRRKTLQSSTTLYAVRTTDIEDDVPDSTDSKKLKASTNTGASHGEAAPI